MTNLKSDVLAKSEFVKILENRGFKAQVKKSPADIKAVKDNQTWYFEIKKTRHTDKYFGAATMTEWQQALKDPEHFRFVVAIELETGEWDFREYTPAEFMEFSTIPPFKVYFNIDFTDKVKKSKKRETKAVVMSEENFNQLAMAFKGLSKDKGENRAAD